MGERREWRKPRVIEVKGIVSLRYRFPAVNMLCEVYVEICI